MNNEYIISVSILNAKDIKVFLKVTADIKEKFKNTLPDAIYSDVFRLVIHFDVMDGKFVKNTGIDLKYIVDAKKLGLYCDTHLMVKNPIDDNYIEDATEYGTDSLTIHYEIDNFEETLKYLNEIKNKLFKNDGRVLDIGVSINPDTDIEVLEKYKSMFSKILIMSVNPGLGGQAYIDDVNQKIVKAKNIFKDKVIQIDGGINTETISKNLEVGIGNFVIGKYLSSCANTDEIYTKLLILNILKDIWTHEKDRNIEFDKKLLQIVPGGYGESDSLIGICVPSIRKLASKWYKYIDLDVLNYFISSKYHEYRQLACFCVTNKLTDKLKKNDIDSIADIYRFFENNLKYINNWDLTDEVAPKVLGSYAKIIYNNSKEDAKKEIDTYIQNENMWIKRMGIVSMLTFVRDGVIDLPYEVCEKFIYTKEPLLQKATGWVLREIYVKDSKLVVEFLKKIHHEKSVPGVILSYACEKMSKAEKEYIKG